MSCKLKPVIILIACLLLPMAVSAGRNVDNSIHEIYRWVKNELKIGKDYPIPEIQLVPRKKLQAIFQNTNRGSFKRWADQYGENRANRLIELYIKEVLGLFIPKTCSIYVGEFIEPCRRNSIIAHELAHYFQHVGKDPSVPTSIGAERIHLFNEYQAGKIENAFTKSFCGRTH